MTHVLSTSTQIQSDALLLRIKDEHLAPLQTFLETYPATAKEIFYWLETNRYWTVIPFVYAADLTQNCKLEMYELYKLFN